MATKNTPNNKSTKNVGDINKLGTRKNTNSTKKPTVKKSDSVKRKPASCSTAQIKNFEELDAETQKSLKNALNNAGINIDEITKIGVTVIDAKDAKKGSLGPVCTIALTNFISAVKQRIADLIYDKRLDLSIIPFINKELVNTLMKSDRLLSKIAYASSVFGNVTNDGGFMKDFDYSRLQKVFDSLDDKNCADIDKRDLQMATYVNSFAKVLVHNAIVHAVDDGIKNISEKEIDKSYTAFFNKVQHAKICLFNAAHKQIVKICKDRFKEVFANPTLKQSDKNTGLQIITEKVLTLVLREIDEDSNYSLIRKFMKDEKDSTVILHIANRATECFNDIIDFCMSHAEFDFRNFNSSSINN